MHHERFYHLSLFLNDYLQLNRNNAVSFLHHNMASIVAVIIYTLYGQMAILAEAEKKGIEAAGGIAHIHQVPETLSPGVIKPLGGAPKPSYPITTNDTLLEHDCFCLAFSPDLAIFQLNGKPSGMQPEVFGPKVHYIVKLLVSLFQPALGAAMKSPLLILYLF